MAIIIIILSQISKIKVVVMMMMMMYTTSSLVTRVSVTTLLRTDWLAAAKLGRLVLGYNSQHVYSTLGLANLSSVRLLYKLTIIT